MKGPSKRERSRQGPDPGRKRKTGGKRVGIISRVGGREVKYKGNEHPQKSLNRTPEKEK